MKNVRQYRTLVNSFPIGIGIHQEGKWVMLNRTALDLLGYGTESELIGRSVLEIVHPDYREKVVERLKHLAESNEDAPPLEEKLVTREGRTIQALINASTINYMGKPAVQVTALDITSFIKLKTSLQKERTRTQTYLDIAGIIFVSLDRNGKITLVNKKACEILGYKPEDLTGKDWFKTCIPAGERKKVASVFKQLMAGGIEPFEYYENHIITRNGGSRLVAWHNTLVRNNKGEITGTISSGEDITEQRQTEERLKETREYARNLIDSSMDMIIAVNNKRKITEFNHAAEETFGYRKSEVLGKHVNLLYANTKEGLTVHKKTVQNGQHVQEIRNTRKNGEIFPTLLSASILKNLEGDKIGVMGVSRDITRYKQAEKRVSRQTALLKAINDIFKKALTCKTEEDLGRMCLAVAETLTDSKFGLIGMVNPEGLFDTIAISNPGWEKCNIPDSERRNLVRNMPIRGIDRATITEGISRIVDQEEIATHPDRVGFPEGHPAVTSFLGVPLKHEGLTVGMIGLGNREGGYQPTHQDAMEALAVVIEEVLRYKKAEENLFESEERFRNLFELSPEGIMIEDSQGTILDANPAFCTMMGYSQEELTGNNVSILALPDNVNQIQKNIKSILSGEKLSHVLKSVRKDGTVIDIDLSEQRLIMPDDSTGILCVSKDITSRVIARDRLRKYSSRINALNEASHLLTGSLDSDITVERCAEIAREIFIGSDVTLFLMDENKKYLRPTIHSGPYSEEIMQVRLRPGEGLTGKVAESGKARIVNRIDLTDIGKHIEGTPLEPESLLSAPLKVKDEVLGVLTLRKLGEEEFLQEDLEFLKNLVDISAMAIQNARLYEASKQSEKVKTLFLANMSHEIRTPLNAIVGFSDLIRSNIHNNLGPEEHRFFDIIQQSSERLLKTIHGVLDISQIEAMSFKLNRESLNLSDLVEQAVMEFTPMAEKKGLYLRHRIDVEESTIVADEYCIQQSLGNLLDNAVKYTETGGISVGLTKKDDNFILTIEDTGIGISKEYQKIIFEFFTQESVGYTKKYQGVGLGMSLTRRYLDLNDISIDIESRKNKGTRFSLTFPISIIGWRAEKLEEKSLPEYFPGEDQRVILIVEDDRNAQHLYKYFLKERYQFCFARSVAEAKAQLDRKVISLVLLDLSLIGDEDGLDLALFMRNSEKWKTIPIIAVTAHSFTRDRDNVLKAGCNDFMAKPIKRDALLKMIDQYI